jgi:ATP-dependent Clp protease ATP-binding subunit ClpX
LIDEYPGQQTTIRLSSPEPAFDPQLGGAPILDATPLTLEKSNILLLGPSGVGKTLMAKTLARVLSVPFSMSDCTPFTQAGYIGEDAEVCVHRLLAASNYDVSRAERGIICLDEVDKIATAKVSHGKDVSGEGVQQALLKIIEGTTLQIQAKPERNAPRAGGASSTYPTNNPLGSSPTSPGSSTSSTTPGKGEIYNVRTDNILFIFTGAFIGLQKIILDRISRGSIGFGQPVRSAVLSSTSHNWNSNTSHHINPLPIPLIPGSEEEALYRKHLPFFTASPPGSSSSGEPAYFNPLDLLTPTDLQTYGLIPELTGRIPITAALNPLSISLLHRILTEPRNSLLSQYVTLFSLSGIELRFTTPALHRVAENALKMGTGARGLRTEMETILGDAMFEAPGSSVKYVLVGERCAAREEGAMYFGRGQGGKFHAMVAKEEGEWDERIRKEKEEKEGHGGDGGGADGAGGSFQEWRGRAESASG